MSIKTELPAELRSVKTELIFVTPEQAGTWLDRHWRRIEEGKFRQRPMGMTRVVRYAQSMSDAQWKASPESIAFDVEDNLIQGQHRLEAVRRSGVGAVFLVSTGWPVETIKVLDQGAVRKNAELLAIKNGDYNTGYASRYAGTISAIARIAYRGHTSTLTFANCEYMLEKLGLKGNIDAVMARSPNFLKDFQSSVVAPLAYYHTVRPKKALEFAEGLFNYETTKGSPIWLYMNWIKSGRASAVEPGKHVHLYQRKMAGLCACIRAWDEGVTVSRVMAQPEAIEWLSDMNPKLRDWTRAHILTNYKRPGNKKDKP